MRFYRDGIQTDGFGFVEWRWFAISALVVILGLGSVHVIGFIWRWICNG